MAEAIRVFYSWQSDSPPKTNRYFILDALKSAIKELNKEPGASIEEPIVLDRDTAGVSGSPDIVQTIFEKIASASIVVSDVTLISTETERKKTPNPNVLVELGYAYHAITPLNVITLMNTYYGSPDDLPFDLKIRRAGTYQLDPAASSDDRARERKKLINLLKEAIRLAIQNKPAPKIEIPPFPTKFMQDIGLSLEKGDVFGQNDWTGKLGEAFLDVSNGMYAVTRSAKSWVSITTEPLHHLQLESHAFKQIYAPGSPIADINPSARFIMPRRTQTEANAIIYYDEELRVVEQSEPRMWMTRYLRILEGGQIEFVDTDTKMFSHWRGPGYEHRAFGFVPIIGTFWRIISLARRIYQTVGYSGPILTSLNLIGTKDTQFHYFSEEPGVEGRKWPQAFSSDAVFAQIGSESGWPLCTAPFLQFTYVSMSSAEDEEKGIYEVARRLGNAYNHQSEPRCFNRGTKVFPWRYFDQLMGR